MHPKKPLSFSSSNQQGFTLVEVALTVIVGGMLLAFFANTLLVSVNESRIKVTQTRMNEIADALRRDIIYKSRLPCPARRTDILGAATYGVALTACRAGDGVIAGTALNNNVRIGMVPTRTLNLPDEYAYDAWGSRFIYAVSSEMTSSLSYNASNATITIGTNPIRAAFAVVSVGADRQGGYGPNGTASACPASSPTGKADLENCDDDNVFTDIPQSQFIDGTPANFNDDFIVYQSSESLIGDVPEGAIMAFRLRVCPKGWDRLREMEGNIIVGSGSFSNPLPFTATGAYTNQSYAFGATGGSATRYGDVVSDLTAAREYKNIPPYIAYRYCVKS